MDNDDEDTEALDGGDMTPAEGDGAERFTVTATDDDNTEGTVTIFVNGTNDLTRFSGHTFGVGSEPDITATNSGSLEFNDPDEDDTANVIPITTPVVGTYGSFTIEANGDGDGDSNWRYMIDPDDPEVDGLQQNEEGKDEFEVTATDGATLKIPFTISGVNDPSTWSGATSGGITEDAEPNTLTRTLSINDPDDRVSVIARSFEGTYGRFSVRSDGRWTYTLDNARDVTNALDSGATGAPERFEVEATDGNKQVVTITVTGANDDTIFGGDLAGTATDDADTSTVSGTMTIDDPDTGGVDTGGVLTDRSPNAPAPGYGTFTIDTNGAWTYTLVNTNALDAGERATDEFVWGAGDVITGAVTEAGGENNGGIGTPTATGNLSISDVDGDDSSIIRAQDFTGVYGSLEVPLGGAWTYTLDDDDPRPGSGRQPPRRSRGHLRRPGLRRQQAGRHHHRHGALPHLGRGRGRHPRVDAPGHNESGTYGTFSIDKDGAWTYTLDNSLDATNALDGGGAVDAFSIAAAHETGTNRPIAITITGANDPPTAPAVVNQDAVEGTAFSYTLPAFTDPEGDAITYAAAPLPGWLTFDAATRAFSGTPPAGTGAGDYDIRVTASDGSASSSASFRITVRTTGAPSFSINAAFDVDENAVSVGRVTATDGEGDDITSIEITGGADRGRFQFGSGDEAVTRLEPGSVPASADLYFREAPDHENPADSGRDNRYVVEITATSGTDPLSTTQTIVVTVTDADEVPAKPGAPTVEPGDLHSTLDVRWTAPSTAGTEPISGYDLRYGSPGSWSAHTHVGTGTTATITGLTAGTEYQVQVRARNAEGESGWSDSATGTPLNRAPVVPTNTRTVRMGQSVSIDLVDDDGLPRDWTRVDVVGLPPGLVYSPAEGRVVGRAQAGTYTVSVTFNDGVNLDVTGEFDIVARSPAPPPTQPDDEDDTPRRQPEPGPIEVVPDEEGEAEAEVVHPDRVTTVQAQDEMVSVTFPSRATTRTFQARVESS